MQITNNKIIKSHHIILFLTSLIIISVKWIYSYNLYDEDIYLRIINDTGDNNYYPLIKSFSNLNFSPSYSLDIENLKLVSFPIISLAINSFFLKLFGGYSFIILELICTFIFLLLFFIILIELGINKLQSIFYSLIILSIVSLLDNLTLLNLNFIEILKYNFESFYTLRFPRPIITNLFFFCFILFVIKFYKSEENSLKFIIPLSILMGISLNSFFYHAVNEFFILIVVFFYKFRKNFFNIIILNYKKILYSILILIIFFSIFNFQVNISESDYLDRLGIFTVDKDQKLVLLNYFKGLIFKKEFLIIFFLNSLIFFFTRNSVLKIFYLVFLSSILSTFFIFYFFNKGLDYYHFINLIIINSIINLILFIFTVINEIKILNLNLKKNIFYNYFIILLLLLYLGFYNFNAYAIKEKNNKAYRTQLAEVTKFIKNEELFDNKKLKIFNLNQNISIWLILNNFNNFSILPVSFWTSKKTEKIENELISTFNFFNLSEEDLENLIENKFKSWRYKNDFIYNLFGRKYLANNLTHYKRDLNDYTHKEQIYIKKNNLLIAHQVILPKSEINRLKNKLILSKNKIDPDVLIVDKNLIFDFKNTFDIYCSIYENDRFKIYSLKDLTINCD
tara:strand:- start:9425 stop:11287 length:1863 start_codon:yes stop_codon:yes gene_type:complete